MTSNTRRMRTGLAGRLMSTDGKQLVGVLYSIDGHGSRGRLRSQDPEARLPFWIDQGARAKLYGYDTVPIDIMVSFVKVPREGWKDDDHFAEFIVRSVTH